jgi:hypothetical protein
MKKLIFALAVIVMFSVVSPATALAWDDCPSGEINDSYPGDCNKYIDTDEDGICDHSQPAPEDRNNIVANVATTEEEIHDLISGQDLKTKTVNEIAQLYKIDQVEFAKALSDYYKVNIKSTDYFQFLQDNYAVEPSIAKDIAVSIRTKQPMATSESDSNKSKKIYDLVPISLFLILLYVISHVLSKKNIISIGNHRKIWNILLLATFLISGILGILLVIKINFGVAIPLPFNILFWHVEAGIAMVIISIFHILWHWAYFKGIMGIKPRKIM